MKVGKLPIALDVVIVFCPPQPQFFAVQAHTVDLFIVEKPKNVHRRYQQYPAVKCGHPIIALFVTKYRAPWTFRLRTVAVSVTLRPLPLETLIVGRGWLAWP